MDVNDGGKEQTMSAVPTDGSEKPQSSLVDEPTINPMTGFDQFEDCNNEDEPPTRTDQVTSPKVIPLVLHQEVSSLRENDVVIGDKKHIATKARFWQFAEPSIEKARHSGCDRESFTRELLRKWRVQYPKGRFIQKERNENTYFLMTESEIKDHILETVAKKLTVRKPAKLIDSNELGPFDVVIGLGEKETFECPGNKRMEGLIQEALKEYIAKGKSMHPRKVAKEFCKSISDSTRFLEKVGYENNVGGALKILKPGSKIVSWLEVELTRQVWSMWTSSLLESSKGTNEHCLTNPNKSADSDCRNMNSRRVSTLGDETPMSNESVDESEGFEPGEIQSVGAVKDVSSKQASSKLPREVSTEVCRSPMKRLLSASSDHEIKGKRLKCNEAPNAEVGLMQSEQTSISEKKEQFGKGKICPGASSANQITSKDDLLLTTNPRRPKCLELEGDVAAKQDRVIQSQGEYIQLLCSQKEALSEEVRVQNQEIKGLKDQLAQSADLLNFFSEKSEILLSDNAVKKKRILSIEANLVSKCEESEKLKALLCGVEKDLEQSTNTVASLKEQIKNLQAQLVRANSQKDEIRKHHNELILSKKMEIKELEKKHSLAAETQIAKHAETKQSRKSLLKLLDHMKVEYRREQVKCSDILRQKEKELSGAKNQIVNFQKMIKERSSKILKLSLNYTVAATAIDEARKEAKAQKVYSSTFLNRLGVKDGQLQQLKSALEEKERLLQQLKSALEAKERQIEQLKHALKAQMDQNASMQNLMTTREKQHDQRKSEKNAGEKKIVALEGNLVIQCAKTAELQKSLNDLKDKNRRDLDAKDQVIAALERDLESRKSQYETDVAAARSSERFKSQALGEEAKVIESLTKKLEDLDGKKTRNEQKVHRFCDELYASNGPYAYTLLHEWEY